MMGDVKVENAKFKPRTRVLETIGGDLIGDEVASILELVKNSYDAGAKKVTLTIVRGEGKKDNYLSIEDNGSGMSREDLLNKWMVPALENKGGQIEGDRPFQGKKGIGRFSATRLGHELKMVTSVGDGISSSMKIDWREVFKVKSLYDVIIPIKIEYDTGSNWHGTILTISSLKDIWDDERVEKISINLRKLIPPIHGKYLNDFQISIVVLDGEKKHEIQIEPYPLDLYADYMVEVTVDKDGSYRGEFRRTRKADTDTENLIIPISGTDIRKSLTKKYLKKSSDNESYPQPWTLPLICQGFTIRLAIWDRDNEWMREKGQFFIEAEKTTVTGFKKYLDDTSGIAIYRNGFRVRPYGDPDQDWLGLAQRRVQNPTEKIGPNQVRGTVDIEPIKNLDDRSSREGLKETPEFYALKGYVIAIFEMIEPHRLVFRKKHGLGGRMLPNIYRLVQERENAFKNLEILTDQYLLDIDNKNRAMHLTQSLRESIEKEHDVLEYEAKALHDNNAMGILARYVIHDIGNLNSTLDTSLDNVVTIVRTNDSGKMITITDGIHDTFLTSLNTATSQVSTMKKSLKRLDPVYAGRRRSNVNIKKIIDSVLSVLRTEIDHLHIDIKRDYGDLIAYIWDTDLFHIVFNILYNSIYWVTRNVGPYWISIQAREFQDPGGIDRIELLISDSGPGVKEEEAPSIFELGVHFKPDGTGMGLFIVREALGRNGGSIQLVNPGDLNATFRIILPKGKQ